MKFRPKTGQPCMMAGLYDFDGYVQEVVAPLPLPDDRLIPMQIGDTFPSVTPSGLAGSESLELAARWSYREEE